MYKYYTKGNKIILKFKNKVQLINENDLIYIEYINRKIYLTTIDKLIEYIHIPLTRFKTALSSNFIQVHQSFVVNINYIDCIDYETNIIKLNSLNKSIPIGSTFKDLKIFN